MRRVRCRIINDNPLMHLASHPIETKRNNTYLTLWIANASSMKSPPLLPPFSPLSFEVPLVSPSVTFMSPTPRFTKSTKLISNSQPFGHTTQTQSFNLNYLNIPLPVWGNSTRLNARSDLTCLCSGCFSLSPFGLKSFKSSSSLVLVLISQKVLDMRSHLT